MSAGERRGYDAAIMSRRSRGRGWGSWNDYGGWPPYVPVAERRAKAERHVAKLRKKGPETRPGGIEGRTIARALEGPRRLLLGQGRLADRPAPGPLLGRRDGNPRPPRLGALSLATGDQA